MVTIVILLTWIRAHPVEPPYIITGQILSVLDFTYYPLNFLVTELNQRGQPHFEYKVLTYLIKKKD